MICRILSLAILMLAVCGSATAQRLPGHYPDRFQRTGKVDDLQESRIIINDIPYTLSESVVVHSLSAPKVSVARLRRGILIGFRLGGNRRIVEIWLLPYDYDESERR